jgi:hypothetical protein
VGGEPLPRRGFDDLAGLVQFAVLRGTCYGATCPGDLSTWQKSTHSSVPSSFEQLPGSLLKSGGTVSRSEWHPAHSASSLQPGLSAIWLLVIRAS